MKAATHQGASRLWRVPIAPGALTALELMAALLAEGWVGALSSAA